MRLSPPQFWWRAPGVPSTLLAPVAGLYGRVAARNLAKGQRAETGVPVLCVGNPTVGGAGKTPCAMALGQAAIALGRKPGFVSRGYGRKGRETLRVDPERHTSREAGDEPLLLAQVAPTAVGADRTAAARRLIDEAGCDFIIMDDGFQSARLKTDLALLLVDGHRGLGNWRVFPAGPLRAPIEDQTRHADAFVVVGKGPAGGDIASLAGRSNRPVHYGAITPTKAERFAGMRVLAFAGIGDPAKFLASLSGVGASVEDSRVFPDHHAYTAEDVAALSAAAWRQGLQLVTTRKDAARLAGGTEALRLFLAECEVLDVAFRFDMEGTAERLIRETLANFRRRRFG